MKIDLDGSPLAFHLTGTEAGDTSRFPILLGIGPDITPRAVVCDKGYGRNANRQFARKHGVVPVIEQKRTANIPQRRFPKAVYRARARIERAVGKIKLFKRIAQRCEKTARNYRAIIVSALFIFLAKSVHAA